MILPPGQMHEFAVGGNAIDHRVTVIEVAIELAEAGDLGGADKSEVLGPEKDEFPFSRVACLRVILEGAGGVGRNHALDGEVGEFVANGQHYGTPWNNSNCE